MKQFVMFALAFALTAASVYAEGFNPAMTFLAWSFAEKLCLMNHELGHMDASGSTSELQLNFGLVTSSGCTWMRGPRTTRDRVDIAAAGLRRSAEMYGNVMFALEGENFSRREQRFMACMGLWTVFDGPMYSLFGQNSMVTPIGGGAPVQGSDIAHLGEMLGQPMSYFEKMGIASLLLNFDNIRDLVRAAAGKGYKKQDRRLFATTDGVTIKAGVTFYR